MSGALEMRQREIMAFLIPDNAKSRPDIPSPIRRVLSSFEIGLDDSAVVWYEPLFDPTGEKPHIIVMMPERGIAVLEVLDVKTSQFLGIFKGKAKFLRDDKEIENPVERAHKLAEILVKRLKQEKRVSRLELNVAAGVCFTNVTASDAKSKGITQALSEEFCIYKEEIDAGISGAGQSTLMRAFTRVVGPPTVDCVTSELEKTLRGLIQPDLVIGKLSMNEKDQLQIFIPPDSENDVVRVMDRQQEAMSKSLGDGHRVIRGVAGSGKTLILVYRAKLLAENFPQKKILVTCFTRTLAAQLKLLMQSYANIQVVHLHALMKDVCHDAKLKIPTDDPDFQIRLETALEGQRQGFGPRFDVVLMDEAQDFNSDALRFAVGLLKNDSEDLVIVADAAQNIYRRKFSWKESGIKAQGRTRILRVNYRNTREILQSANSFLLSSNSLVADDVPDFEDENTVIPPESASRSGSIPELEVVPNVLTEVNRAVEIAAEWSKIVGENEKIAILYPGKDGKDRGYFLNMMLRNSGVDFYWATDKKNWAAKAGMATAKQKIILSTIHSAKGLEYPYVILCGIWKEKQDIEQNRKLAYVGMTRATDRLTVITREGHDLVTDLKAAFLS